MTIRGEPIAQRINPLRVHDHKHTDFVTSAENIHLKAFVSRHFMAFMHSTNTSAWGWHVVSIGHPVLAGWSLLPPVCVRLYVCVWGRGLIACSTARQLRPLPWLSRAGRWQLSVYAEPQYGRRSGGEGGGRSHPTEWSTPVLQVPPPSPPPEPPQCRSSSVWGDVMPHRLSRSASVERGAISE